MTLFELAATLSLDTTKFNQGVRQASDTGRKFADTLSQNVTAKAVALGNALYKAAETGARALINLGKSAVTAAAEVSAENAQFEAAFGDIQKAAHNVFNAIGRDTNILATRLRGVGTKAFSQFKGAGLEAAEALGMTDKYTRLAADAAAYYDISLEAADERLRSFLRGNTEAGDAIGLFTSESQRNTYAMEQYGKKWLDLTEAQKQMLMLNVAEDIYAQSGAIGQAERESSNWANTVANLDEIWRQTLARLASPFTDSLTPFIENLTARLDDETFKTNIDELAAKIGEIAGYSLDEVAAGLNTLMTGEIDPNSSLSNFVGSLQELYGWAQQNSGIVNAALGAFAVAVTAINTPLALLVGGIALLILNWNTITSAAEKAKEAVEEFFETKISPALETVIRGISSAFGAVSGAISTAISRLREFFRIQSSGPSGGRDLFSDHPAYNGGYGQSSGYGLGSDGGSSAAATFFDSGTGLLNKLPGKAVGMDYVPHNQFVARLHEGEAVLTKAEATAWRRGEGQGFDMAGLTAAVTSAVREGLRGMSVRMDGKAVGNVVTDQVSRNIAQAAWAGRYSG